MAYRFHIGQRWLSESEPELGLGTVEQFTERTVTIDFPATGEKRQYALESAPLRRVRFDPGHSVQLRDGSFLVIEAVTERDGLTVYQGGGLELPENELSDQVGLSAPESRLRRGHVDASAAFDLRCAALRHQHHRRKSPVRGFVGGRIELIPHQLYVAPEVAGRLLPRVLLADEVGLGKTIEACLIVHRWIQTGRARRVLILVPEPLVHQWFVELLRRFNLWFHIFDEERCEAIEQSEPSANPFLDDQLVLSATSFLAGNADRARQAAAASWDMVVVDEAHHLGWTPEAVSPEYALVESLAARTSGLLLLTATPEQLGMASHFARMRLLDPDRYFSLRQFLAETAQYQSVAALADKLLNQEKLAPADRQKLASILQLDPGEVAATVRAIEAGDGAARSRLLEDLVDRHGTGRVVFRNTRAIVKGFPKRTLRMYPLRPSEESARLLDRLADEFAADTAPTGTTEFEPQFARDPRIPWLAELVRQLKQNKLLLICRTQAKVLAIHESLRSLVNLKVALFHEGLPLVQRDRNAAWFAENDGAQILLASEIGSEGRNFQFAHDLVLFDLPLDPELLEQRIGRLDRIGQKSEIQIHVPFVVGSPQEVLATWFHGGLEAFERNLRGGHPLLERFGARVRDLAQDFHETQETSRAELDRLVGETQSAAREIAGQLEHGRDRLLELTSFRPGAAQRIIREIQAADQDRALEDFLLTVFDQFTIQVEELAPRTYYLGSAGIFSDSFPGLPAGGLTVTLDRQRALAREDIQFLTWDHPLATGALDLILSSELGNSSMAHWPQSRNAALYLEAIYLLECIAPPALHVDRFLPPTPIRVVVDHQGNDAAAVATSEVLRQQIQPSSSRGLLEQPEMRDHLIPALLAKTGPLAARQIEAVIAGARAQMSTQLSRELTRLKELQKVNPNITGAEIGLLAAQQPELDRYLSAARLRLDALRLIV